MYSALIVALTAINLQPWCIVVPGLWPGFLQSGSDSGRRRVLDINLVDHFVSAQHDGSMITWAHGVNSRERLKQALMSMLLSYIVVVIFFLFTTH